MCVRVCVCVQVWVWPDPVGRPRRDGFNGSPARILAALRAVSGPAGDHGAAGAVWRERKTPAEHDRVRHTHTVTVTQNKATHEENSTLVYINN